MRELRFVLTPFCNYSCFFCHCENITDETTMRLSPKDYAFMARAVRDHYGWDTCTITGGEPLLSPIFGETCELLKENSIATTVVTNASLLARPEDTLKYVAQLNVSLHSVDPDIYKEITGTRYPLENVLDTIATVRARLPMLEVHLNYTVIKGTNDDVWQLSEFLAFAAKVGATAKFIDYSTRDNTRRLEAHKIVDRLKSMGFTVVGESPWQYHMTKGEEKVSVVRCPFNGRYEDLPVRDIFVSPSGVLYRSFGGELSVDALNEIKSRNAKRFIQKIEVLLR